MSNNAPKTILWTAEEAAQAVHAINAQAVTGWQATGISIDTRSLAPGDIFIALKGPNHDGHEHAGAALENGAAAVIVSRIFPGAQQDDARVIMVEDTMQALEDLGHVSRHRASKARIIAVTGSVGKTSTKSALGTLLAGQGRCFATTGSLNNHWGVPLSLARMPEASRFGVFELGMNHAGELSALTRQVQPHVAIITNIAAVHLEHFADTTAIADAKAEIMEGMGQEGAVILPRDNDHYPRLLAAARTEHIGQITSFGKHEQADARLLTCATLPEGGSSCTASIFGETVSFTLSLPGEHHASNAVAILAAIHLAGGDIRRAAQDYHLVGAVEGRGTRHSIALPDGGRLTLIDETYNASPLSTAASLKVLGAELSAQRRVALLGDMLELGKRGPELHAGLATEMRGIDVVHTAGPLMQHLHDALPDGQRGQHFPDSAAMADHLATLISGGDTVMVKGSNGSRMKQVVEALRAMDRATDKPAEHDHDQTNGASADAV